MQIDRNKALGAFAAYAARYNDRDPKVKLKIDHTYRVAGLCARIAAAQGLDAAGVDLAWLCGLLHDVGRFEQLRSQGSDPVRVELLPRVIAGVFASITLAALSCVVALVLAYLGVYGFNLAGLPSYTRMFGQVFSPSVTMVFALKTVFFSLAVALIPMAAGLYDTGDRTQPDSELGGLARMFAVLLMIEVASLMGNYY